jgi:VWFA-related protein
MDMPASRRILICSFVLSLPMLAGQRPIQPIPVQPTPGMESTIRLDVVVNDKSGKPVSGLEQKDFTLLDNKLPEKILSFEAVPGAAADSEPVEVILVVDSVNIPFMRVAQARDQIKKFLQQDGGKLPRPLSIAFLSDSGLKAEGTASRDGNALVAYLDQNASALRTITKSQGFYGADERMQLSVNAFEQLTQYAAQRPGKKIIICISPGWPLLTGPRDDLTQKNQNQIFSTIVAMSTNLREAGVTLYMVDPLGPGESQMREFYYQSFLKGVRSPRQVVIGDLSLQVLASQSGGRVLTASNDIADGIASCVRDANAYYVLSFAPPPADGPNEYHAIEVKMDQPHLKAQTRAGYYDQPAQKPL